MVNLIRRLFARGLKAKATASSLTLGASDISGLDERIIVTQLADSANAACVRSLKENFRQCMYDPTYKNHRGDYRHSEKFIENNEAILKGVVKQQLLDSKFMDNLEVFLQGDIQELSKHSKTSTEYDFDDPDLVDSPSDAASAPARNRKCPPSETLFNRPWLIKMRTNDDGFPTLKLFAIDDDGEIMQADGHPVPPLPGDAPKNEWKALSQSLKLREIPPAPKCPKHKHLEEPKQYELVRETVLQATIHNRRVSNGRASLQGSDNEQEDKEPSEEKLELPDPRRLTIRSREMQERMIRNAYFHLIGRRTRAKEKKTSLSAAYAKKHGSSEQN